MAKKIGKITVVSYIRRGGTVCPFCGSDQTEHIAGGFITVDSGQAEQGIHCYVCEKSWTDLYRLVGAIESD
jgi:transposase-like protein